jgi:hypothetical protein
MKGIIGDEFDLIKIFPNFWSRFQLASKQWHKCFKGCSFSVVHCSI